MPTTTKPLEIVKLIKTQVVGQQVKGDPAGKTAKMNLATNKQK
jgi:hypothetical protein